MINPITQILMTKRAELNEDLAHYKLKFRRGKISFDEYKEKTRELIKYIIQSIVVKMYIETQNLKAY